MTGSIDTYQILLKLKKIYKINKVLNLFISVDNNSVNQKEKSIKEFQLNELVFSVKLITKSRRDAD